MPPSRRGDADSLDELLKKGEGKGGPAAEALRKAARLKRADGDLLGAAELLEQACEKAEAGPMEAKLHAVLELELGQLYEQELGRLDQAMERYQRAFKLDPDNAKAIDAGRRVYRALGDWVQVARLYEVELETLSEPARRAELLLELGLVRARKLNDLVGAAVRLEEAVRLKPQDPVAKEALAGLYISPDFPMPPGETLGPPERAAALFLELAAQKRKKDDLEGEVGLLKRALGADPYHLDAAVQLERAYLALGDAYVEELRRLYRQDAPVPHRHQKRAVLAARAHELDEAMEAAVLAHAEGDDASEAITLIDQALAVPGKEDWARMGELRKRLLDAAPPSEAQEYCDRLVEIAGLYERAHRGKEQEASLEEALACDPSHGGAFAALLQARAAKRDQAGLAALSATVEQMGPEDQPLRLFQLAEVFEKRLGDAGAAMDLLRRAEAIQPSQKGQQELRRLKQKEDRWASLSGALEKELAGAVGPARADVLKRLAQVYRERHQMTRARDLIEEAIEIRPDDGALYRALADLHEASGDLREVAKTLKRQLKASKEKVEKLNLLRRLAVLCDERLGDLEGVVSACEEILAVLPGDRDALRRLEDAHGRAGRDGEEPLVGVLEKHASVAATPQERMPLLHQLAGIYERRGDFAAAGDRLERILKIDKGDGKAQEAIARVYEKAERWPDAAMALDRWLQRADAPKGAQAADGWKRFARIVDGKLNDPTRAVRAWREVLDRRPTDREALEALGRLSRARGDHALLDELLARRLEHAEGAEEVELTLERAALKADHLNDRAGAIALLRRVIEELDPRHVEAHARLRKLERAAGNLDGAIRLAERELFLENDAGRKLTIALDIARAWRDDAKDARRARSAFERVIDLDPTSDEALAALSLLYGEAGDFERKIIIDEQRLTIAESKSDFQQAVALNFELAMTAERDLKDPKRAFDYFRRAHDLEQSDGTLGELRRVAEAYGLWEEMCAVYAGGKGLEPRLRVAEIADEKLRDPKRAFSVLKASLSLDPTGERLLPELERLSERAADPQALLEVYEALLDKRALATEKVGLLRKRAEVREKRQRDASGALDEMLRAFRLWPDDPEILAEVHRLAGATSRWEDALVVEGTRFHRARDPQERLQIALEAAALVEERVKDDLRAFRAYLRAFQLKPDDTAIRDHLWRLARKIPLIDEKPPEPPPVEPKPDRPVSRPAPVQPKPAAQPVARDGDREDTLEIKLDELIYEDSKPIVLSAEPAEQNGHGAPAATEKRRDPTVELTLQDLMPALKKPPQNPKTIDLSLSDLSPVAARKQPPKPPAFSARAAMGGATPPPPPIAQPRISALIGPHSAWDELAVVLMSLPAESEADHFAHLLLVCEMWEKGAEDLDRAFESLASAFRLDPDDQRPREALERLAQTNDAWDKLIAVLDEVLEETGNADRVVRLLDDAAGVRERQGLVQDAEERYLRALGIKPSDEVALERLEALYRRTSRLQDLASLLERRLHGLLERMQPGEARRLRALELASVYEQLGNTYEAISAWKRVADENPDHAAAFAALARLYESVGQWSKVVESLTRELDVHETSGAGGQARAKQLRRRVAQIYEDELELPERAIEAWSHLHEIDPADEEADKALERLYTKLSRWRELDALLAERVTRTEEPEARARVLEQRATLLEERLPSSPDTVTVLRQLRRLRPDDTRVGVRLEEALARAGLKQERVEALRERIQQAARRGLPEAERAQLLIELGGLLAELGDVQEAQRTLERALDLQPSDPQALAELARLREGGSDWDGYAAAREREAEVAREPERALRALVDAARVHAERRDDLPAARKALERAIERDGQATEVLAALGAVARRQGDHARADEVAARELQLLGDGPETAARRAELHIELAQSALRGGDLDGAGRGFREALALKPGLPGAVEGLADVAARTGAWDEVEALLRDAAVKGGVPPQVAAQFHRRLADAAEQQGRPDDAYTALLEADRLVPGDLRTRIALGENRYRQNRFREAAQYLGAIADHPDRTQVTEAGEALHHAALAELKLRRPERVEPLLQAAVDANPRHAAALGLLAERAIERGDLERAVMLLERQADATPGEDERAARFEKVADVIHSELRDAERAADAYSRAVDAAGKWATSTLLEKALRLERETGRLERAVQTAARLLERDAPPAERARRLREAASLDAALGATAQAKQRLKEALALDPLNHETLAGLSAMLVTEGADEEAATLLTRALPLLPPPGKDSVERMSRATLWMRLGECRERLRDQRGATAAFEKALEADAGRRPLREQLLQRYGEEPAHDEIVRGHRMRILTEDPLHVPSLRAMAAIERRAGVPEGGRRFLQLLAVVGALSDEERHALSAMTPSERDGLSSGDAPTRGLDEGDHELLAHPEALPLAPVFAAVWEGTAPSFGGRAQDLASLGVRPEDRVSPVAPTDLARIYSICSLLLGNRKTGLYQNAAAGDGLTVIAAPPTAIVVGPGIAQGRSLNDVRFLLGRALEIARPEYVLAEALHRDDFVKLFSGILRAFHPRHARRSRDDDAAQWKRALPYKVARRLAELFAARADTEFSSANWRRAVRHTGNRAGLVASGDLVAAARVLRGEGDEEAVHELARFAVSDDYIALRTKIRR